jgi:hypothetical protein
MPWANRFGGGDAEPDSLARQVERSRVGMPEPERFRKKPVEVEAISVDRALRAAENDWGGLPVWLSEAYEAGDVVFACDHIIITTLEGSMLGQRGDWLIRGVQGELYPCKPDIFAATYEAL